MFKYNGEYDVTLKVTTQGGTDTRTIKNMIRVTNGEVRPDIPEEPAEPEKEICMKAPYMDGVELPTKLIISTLNDNADNLPNSINGFIKMESYNKPFVITRLSNDERKKIKNPIEGMLIWNTTEQCLELYKDFGKGKLEWNCITQGCDNKK